MSNIVDLIKEKGIAEKIQNAVNNSANFLGETIPQDVIDDTVEGILQTEIMRNPDLEEKFAEYAFDLAFDNIVKELGITYDPDSAAKMDAEDKFLAYLAAKLVGLA